VGWEVCKVARKQKLPAGMRWRGERISVSVYDPERGAGSVHLGTYDTLGEAEKAKAAFEREKKRKRAGFRAWTAREFVEIWCVTDYLRTQATTNMHNVGMVKGFGEDFGDMTLREISETPDLFRLWCFGGVVREDLERYAKGWRGAVRDARGRWTVPPHVRHGRTATALFADALRSGIVDVNPGVALRFPSIDGRMNITPLEPAVVLGLIGQAEKLFPDVPGVAALVATAAYTGMRLGELLGLRWDDLDMAGYRVDVRRQLRSKVKGEASALPKYGSVRNVVLPPIAVQYLERVPRNLDGFVFHTRTGKRYTDRTHHYYWSQVRLSMDPPMPKLAFHELRHFCGSYMADKGATPRDIAHQLGHKNEVLVARIYCHTYPENANERVSGIYGV
jgi:integrase